MVGTGLTCGLEIVMFMSHACPGLSKELTLQMSIATIKNSGSLPRDDSVLIWFCIVSQKDCKLTKMFDGVNTLNNASI